MYNPCNYKLSSPFQQLDHYNVYQGFCELNHTSFVWNPPVKRDCPQLNKVETTTMIIYISPTLEADRLEISKLAISIALQSQNVYSLMRYVDFQNLQ